MERAILISACDARYFALAGELIESVRTAAPTLALDLGLLDLGLLPEQRQHFAAAGIEVVTPDWDIPGIRLPANENWYKAMTARPFLPRYFANHDLLMWLDADVWVQRGEALASFLQGAERFGLAIVPEAHAAYNLEKCGAVALHTHTYQQAFGPAHAAHLMQFPILNSGAFAARRTSPIWGKWASFCQVAMSRCRSKHSEQAALNAALYCPPGERLEFAPAKCDFTIQHGVFLRLGGEPFCQLPASCNWVCALALPLWDLARREFVAPVAPHEPLGLIHLCHPAYHEPLVVPCWPGGSRQMGFRRKHVLESLLASP
jgi:hypothetical protein